MWLCPKDDNRVHVTLPDDHTSVPTALPADDNSVHETLSDDDYGVHEALSDDDPSVHEAWSDGNNSFYEALCNNDSNAREALPDDDNSVHETLAGDKNVHMVLHDIFLCKSCNYSDEFLLQEKSSEISGRKKLGLVAENDHISSNPTRNVNMETTNISTPKFIIIWMLRVIFITHVTWVLKSKISNVLP